MTGHAYYQLPAKPYAAMPIEGITAHGMPRMRAAKKFYMPATGRPEKQPGISPGYSAYAGFGNFCRDAPYIQF